MTMTLVETVTVGSGGAASIEFTSIPQDGVDLLIKLSLRNDGFSAQQWGIRFNADSSSSYSMRTLYGDGSSVASTSEASQPRISFYGMPGADSGFTGTPTPNVWGSTSVYVSNYTSSSNKSVSVENVEEANLTNSIQQILAGSYATSSAISSVQIVLGQTLVQYSTASLYIIS